MFKVSIYGAGFVGAAAAQNLALSQIANVVLIDIDGGVAAGKSLDLLQTGPVLNHSASLIGGADYEATRDSHIVVITAGIARKPGMTREDLLRINSTIVSSVAREAYKLSPNAIFIVVTNPLDVMTSLVQMETGLPSNQVIGMAGVLDSARLESFIAEYLQVSPLDVRAMVLGGHGDLMVPLPRHASVKGVPVSELIPAEELNKMMQRTVNGGAEIVALLKTGSAYFAPGASVAAMVKSILLDERRLLPCSVKPHGEYGLSDVYVGLPCIIGKNGLEKIVQLQLTAEEQEALRVSAESIKTNTTQALSLLKPLAPTTAAPTEEEPSKAAEPVKADSGTAK
ncbi:MAG: malate dehydrogenase [Candidatus Obscuribacter sp.]|nr:malate dehydrogenase [Candidatus Obscuribacter sp.]